MSGYLVVDPEKCVMSGECIYNHPQHFGWSEDGRSAVALSTSIDSDDDRLHAEQAVSLCPAGAISIFDEG